MDFTCRAFNGAYAIARLNQTINLSDYNYIKATATGAASFRLGIGISTSTAVSSINGFTAKADIGFSGSGLSKATPILNINNITGSYYIYLFANAVYADGSGGKANSFSQLWLTNS